MLHKAAVSTKSVVFEDQKAEASQTSSKVVAQQRLDFLGHLLHHEPKHEHHVHIEHDHDPGYWKKKVVWKEGWKKIWKPAKKEILKPAWKKIWTPIWVQTERAVVKDIDVPAWKQVRTI